jgi:hypothetical protein
VAKQQKKAVRCKPTLNFSEVSQRVACDAWLTEPQCAWLINQGASTLKQWRLGGKSCPPWRYLNTRVVYRPSEVQRWMDQQNGGTRGGGQ